MRRKITCIILSILAFICYYPIIYLIVGALTGTVELQRNLAPVLEHGEGYPCWHLIPYSFSLRSLVEILLDMPGFFVMFWNSVKMTGGVLIGQVLVGIPAAWGFAKFRFPLRKQLFFIYIVLMMMPFQVVMLSNYLVLDRMNLLNTIWSIILPGVFSTFPVFIMYHSFVNVPDSLIEAARIDGAGELQILFRIGIPIGRAGIISALVLGFLEYWNLIEQPMTFLKERSLWSLSLFLPEIEPEWIGTAFAASVIALVPSVLVFFAGQDYLEQGIAKMWNAAREEYME